MHTLNKFYTCIDCTYILIYILKQRGIYPVFWYLLSVSICVPVQWSDDDIHFMTNLDAR
jgi:hypothetical protein